VTQADAISFTGGSNQLTIQSGAHFAGNVVFGAATSENILTLDATPTLNNATFVGNNGSDTFQLGGSTGGTFDVSALGTTYTGFTSYEKVGTSTWTLTGSPGVAKPWTITQGTLAISNDASLGAASAGLTLNGGTLELTQGITSTRDMTLMASGTIQADALTSSAWSGNITGPGGFTKTGAGIFDLVGDASYSGATNVTGGTLIISGANTNSLVVNISNDAALFLQQAASINPYAIVTISSGSLNVASSSMQIGSLAGGANSSVSLNGTSLVVGGNNSSTVFAGTLRDGGGSASLTKIGTGTLVLSGTNTYTGATIINGGTLEVDGAITGTSGLTVNAGGTLSGTGTVDPPLPITIGSGATLTPGVAGVAGSSLNLVGNLTLSPGSFYQVYLNRMTSSFANVTGGATLTGSNAIANFLPDNYVSKKYTILTTTGGLGGTTFAGLTNVGLPTGASDSLSYDANNVYLNLTAGFTNYTGLNTNQQNVANALTGYFNANNAIPMRFFGLSAGGLTQVDGEVTTGAERASFRLMDEFLNLMVDPFGDGHFGNGFANGGSGAMGFAPDRQTELPSDVALAYAKVFTKVPPQQPNFEQRWNVWGAGFGGSGRTSGDAAVGSNDTTLGTFGYAGGIDYRVSSNTVLGVALAGGGSNWSLSGGLGSGRSDAFQAGAYGVTRAGAAYVAGSAAFANHWFTTDRTALGDNLHANVTGQVYGGRLETGYRYAAAPNFGITPYASVQAMGFHSGSYSETDLSGLGFGLNYGAKDASDVRTELGARFDNPTLLYGTPLIVRARLAWAHDFVDTPSMSAAFQALPGTNFTVFGAPIPQDSALASLGAEWYLGKGWKLLAKFDGEFAGNSDIYAGSIALRTNW